MTDDFDRAERRHFANEGRLWDKLGRQLADAETLVGELSNGEFYINVRSKDGRLNGATRRFARKGDALSYLIRNRYV